MTSQHSARIQGLHDSANLHQRVLQQDDVLVMPPQSLLSPGIQVINLHTAPSFKAWLQLPQCCSPCSSRRRILLGELAQHIAHGC